MAEGWFVLRGTKRLSFIHSASPTNKRSDAMQCRIYPRKTTVAVAPIQPGGEENRMRGKSKRRKREIADLVCRMNETASFL